MVVAGCDIGSLTTKVVLLNNTKVIAQNVKKSQFNPVESANEVMDEALKLAGLTLKDIEFCVGTGYGRERIPFVNKAVSEIACHAKGAHFSMPSIRTVIDIGGQDCKAIRINDKGTIEKFFTNDKCASGTGRFLEVMAKILGVSLEELGSLSAYAKDPITLSSNCTAWSQAEVILHLNLKRPKADIAAGINQAMAARVALLAKAVGIEKDICMTGGVAKNIGVVTAMEKQLALPIRRLRMDPQLVGALGAAVLAQEKVRGGK